MDYIYIAYLKKLHLEVIYRRKYLKWEAHQTKGAYDGGHRPRATSGSQRLAAVHPPGS